MKVFQIKPNPNIRQFFEPLWLFAYSHAIAPDGDLSYLYIHDTRYLPTDFYNPGSDYFITSWRATEVLREHLERAGRVLPFMHAGVRFALTDVNSYLNALDVERTEFYIGPTSGLRLHIERYAFCAAAFPAHTSLFKLHDDVGSQIYVLEGRGGFAREFREIVQSEGLEGLAFREIWNDEQEPEFLGAPWSITDHLLTPEEVVIREELGIGDDDFDD